MTVEEYLVKRILDLETEKINVQILREDIKDLNEQLDRYEMEKEHIKEQLDRYEMEKEHIKELITCNINPDGDLVLLKHENDLKTLLAILDIKPEDYEQKMMGQTFDPDC